MFNKLKSSEPDFSSLVHDPYLDIINKNILYLTHTMDKCLAVLKRLETDAKLQKKVNEYFEPPLEDMTKTIPEDEER